MKIALALTGNLRTFLMQVRDGKERLCDLMMRNVAEPNNTDVFVYTDTSDFYCQGSQIWPEDKRIEIINNNAFRVAEHVRFLSHSEAALLIEHSLKEVFGKRYKAGHIEKPVDVTNDEGFKRLQAGALGGSIHVMMVAQHRKIRLCHDEIVEYEHLHGPYDLVIKARFDLRCNTPFLANACDWVGKDILVPQIKGPLVMDWYAIGKRDVMRDYMTIYDRIGFAADKGRLFVGECRHCALASYVSTVKPPDGPKQVCTRCGHVIPNIADVSGASEYHVYRTLADKGRRLGVPPVNWYIYRYRDDMGSIHDASADGVQGATLVNFSADNQKSETVLEKKA